MPGICRRRGRIEGVGVGRTEIKGSSLTCHRARVPPHAFIYFMGRSEDSEYEVYHGQV